MPTTWLCRSGGVRGKATVELFPADEVERLARETGFQRRERKLDPVAFLLTLALETGPKIQKSVADLHRVGSQKSGPGPSPEERATN